MSIRIVRKNSIWSQFLCYMPAWIFPNPCVIKIFETLQHLTKGKSWQGIFLLPSGLVGQTIDWIFLQSCPVGYKNKINTAFPGGWENKRYKSCPGGLENNRNRSFLGGLENSRYTQSLNLHWPGNKTHPFSRSVYDNKRHWNYLVLSSQT